MIRICYRCKIIFGEKEPFEDHRKTHGLCDECFIEEMNEIEAKLAEIKKARLSQIVVE